MSVDWEAYAKRLEADIAEIQEFLNPLVAGEMKLGERKGGEPWRDVTQEAVDREKRAIATLSAILKDVRKNRIQSGS